MCHIGDRSSVSDLSSKRGEDFFCRADLIRDRDQDRLFISRGDRGQREHVSFDNVFLDGRQVEIALGIFASNARVMEAVKLFEFDIVPVIKEIVVKKRASYQLLLLKAEGEDHGPEQSSLSHSNTVVIAGALAVLLVLFKLVQPSGLENRRGKVFEKNVTLD